MTRFMTDNLAPFSSPFRLLSGEQERQVNWRFFNLPSLGKLRGAVGPVIWEIPDPSHLFPLGVEQRAAETSGGCLSIRMFS